MKAPQITKYDVDAAHKTLAAAEELEEYARAHPDGAVSAERMAAIVEVLTAFHSTLSVLKVAQDLKRKEEQNHSLEAFADG